MFRLFTLMTVLFVFCACEGTLVGYPGTGTAPVPDVELGEDEAYERLTESQRLLAAFQFEGDVDEWSIVNVSGTATVVSVSTVGIAGDCPVDTLLEVFDDVQGETLLASDDDGGGGLCSRVEVALEPGEAAFLRVSALSPVEGDTRYLLLVEFGLE